MFELLRDTFTKESTIGELYHNGDYICDTLEDCMREGDDGMLSKEEKHYGKTAIPQGVYEILLRDSPRYKRTMPYLMEVPHFTDVMIHTGNCPDDTLGCILVGVRNLNIANFIFQSRRTFDELVFPLIEKDLENGRVFIDVRNAT